MASRAEPLITRQHVNVTLVDTETTSLDPASGEVVGVSLLCLRVAIDTGRVERVVASTHQWRQPISISPEVETLIGVTHESLKGRRFDERAINEVVSVTDLVIAHNADFDRSFLESVIPSLIEKPWACSMTDIQWRSEEGLKRASIDFLLSHYGAEPSSGAPGDDCRALAFLLDQPLPRSACTGFRRLIEAAAVAPRRITDGSETAGACRGRSRRGDDGGDRRS
ncbi:MAG: hypothetical protein HZB72_00125 [Burkholderiales bacterium]|nr:hypothetical protein [Burkholderiales bacterium]